MKNYNSPPEEWTCHISPKGAGTGSGDISWDYEEPFLVEMHGQEFVFPEGVSFRIKYDWHEKHLCVILSVRAKVYGQCGKCLEELYDAVQGSLRYTFTAIPAWQGLSENGEEELILVDSLQNGITMDLPFWETLVDSLPKTLLCKETCKGLCSQCGVNLNSHRCSCIEPQRVDKRFACLKDIDFQEEGGK